MPIKIKKGENLPLPLFLTEKNPVTLEHKLLQNPVYATNISIYIILNKIKG